MRRTTQPRRGESPMTGLKRWSAADSLELYNIEGWGQGYFQINDAGHLIVRPIRRSAATIDLIGLIEDAQRNGLALPPLIRFSDIIDDRLTSPRQALPGA